MMDCGFGTMGCGTGRMGCGVGGPKGVGLMLGPVRVQVPVADRIDERQTNKVKEHQYPVKLQSPSRLWRQFSLAFLEKSIIFCEGI